MKEKPEKFEPIIHLIPTELSSKLGAGHFERALITDVFIERFSFECRKVIGFAITTLRDWLKRFAQLFHPIRSKTKTNCDALACIFPRFASATCNYFEWFTVLSVFFVIGKSNYFGFGFTTLK